MKRSRTQRTHQKLLALALVGLVLALAINLRPNVSFNDQPADTIDLQTKLAQLPLAFEPNQGQVDPAVDYLVHHGQASTYFTDTSITTVLGADQITMDVVGAAPTAFTALDQLPSNTNYFIGSDPLQWHTGVPNYQKILAKNIYPGIDLVYYGTNSRLEHDFIVAPGVDYHQIAFSLTGQHDLTLDENGNISIGEGDQQLHLNAPTTYQQGSHDKHTIPSEFRLNGNTVTVAITGTYDATKPLIIDPTLVYSTYLGGSSDEFGRKIATDSSGNAYIAGQTKSSNFPTASPYQGSFGGTEDAFVTKLNASGTALVYSTYLGGSGTDQAIGLTIDSSGNAYIVGNTDSTDFPTASPYQAANAGTQDAFVAKLNAAGSALTYSTYLGGSLSENGRMIAVDSSDNAYVTGSTQSSDYPTASPYQATNTGSPNSDAFLTKFNPAGSALVFSTYLGGVGSDFGDGLAVNTFGNAYVVGYTDSTDFPTFIPYQAANAGDNDVFITKFDPGGSSLSYSTYFGGSGTDFARGLAIDSTDNAYLTGLTNSTNYPTLTAFQSINAGGYDAFVTKLDAGGSPSFSTYLGGSADDQGLAIAINTSGEAFVGGLTGSSDFPTLLPYQSTKGASDDAFVAKLNAAGSTTLYSTYLGGNGEDIVFGITVGTNNNAYISGYTDSTDFPTLTPYQASNGGGVDVFVTQLADSPLIITGTANPSLTFIIGSTTCNLGHFSATQTKSCTHTIAAASNATGGYVISYIPTTTLTSGANTITAMSSQTGSVVGSEQFGLNLKANTAAGSFTATDFGADPSGGSGTVMSGYQTANLFKFETAGADIAQTTGPSNLTTFTASFIANITTVSEAGTYTTPVTYNIVASY